MGANRSGSSALEAARSVRFAAFVRDHASELLALGAVAVAVATQFGLTWRAEPIRYVWIGFIIAIAMFGAATAIYLQRARANAAPPPEIQLSRRVEVACALAVFGIAAFFRFWHFSSFPPGLWYDEALNARDAATLINGDHVRLWFDSALGYSTLYLYLLAGSIRLFGYTVFALRIVPALAGLAAVVAFYPLARRLCGAVPALVATALLAASRWAVTFSRISWEASLQPVIEVLAIYLLIRGIEKKSRASLAFAGIGLAAGLYSYIAFRLVPVYALLFLLYMASTQRRLIRENLVGLAIWMAVFAAAVAPLAIFAAQNPDRFLARTREVNVFREVDRAGSYEPLRHNIRVTFEMMNLAGDSNGRHNLSGAPMLDDVTAALLVLGLVASLWSFRGWRRGVLAPWFVLALVPGALTLRIENPSAIRDIGAIPPIFLLVGLAVAVVWRPLSTTRGGVRVFAALAMLCVAGSVALNYNDLFRHQARSQATYDGFVPVFTEVGTIIANEAGRSRVYVSAQFDGNEAVTFLAHGRAYHAYTPAYDIVFARDGSDVLLILDDNQVAIVDTLRRLYPHLRTEDRADPFGRAEFTLVTIPGSDTVAVHDLVLTLTGADGTQPKLSRASIDREWTATDLASGAVRATWDGYVWVTKSPADTPMHLAVPGSDASIEVDGKSVALAPDTAGGSTAILGPLSLGEHHIRIAARITAPGRVQLQLAIGGGSLADAVDAADLLYGTSLGDRGFRVEYRAASDFSGGPVTSARVPFAVPAPAIAGASAIEYRGLFDVATRGAYGFALDGTSSAQVFVDDDLLIDEGGTHPRERLEGTLELAPGPHTIAIQYIAQGTPDWSLSLRPAGDEEWNLASGSEFRVPEGRTQALGKVTLAPERGSWTTMPLRVDGIDALAGVAVLRDGTVVAGGGNRLALIGPGGATVRSFTIDAKLISDLDVTASGEIVVVDADARELLLVTLEGQVIKRFRGPFQSAIGVSVDTGHNVAYVASPAGGILYRVSLGDGAVTTLPISAVNAVGKPAQPSDIAVSDSGDLYIADFQSETIIHSADGVTGQVHRGVGGTGEFTPRVALLGPLVLVTDPVNERIVAYDHAGKQRGLYVFPETPLGIHPTGIAVARGTNVVFVVTDTGVLYRLDVDIPAATAAELSGG